MWICNVIGAVALGGLVCWLVSRKRKPAEEGEAQKPPKLKEPSKNKDMANGGDAKAPLSSPGRRPAMLRDLSNATDTPEHEIIADTVQIGRATAQSDDIQSILVKINTVGRRHAVI